MPEASYQAVHQTQQKPIAMIREKYAEYFLTSYHTQTLHALQNIPVWTAYLLVLYYVLLLSTYWGASNKILFTIVVFWIGIPLLITWGTYKEARHWHVIFSRKKRPTFKNDLESLQLAGYAVHYFLALIILGMSLGSWFPRFIPGTSIKSPINFYAPFAISIAVLIPSLQFFYNRRRWGDTTLRKVLTWVVLITSLVLCALSFEFLDIYANISTNITTSSQLSTYWIRPFNSFPTPLEILMVRFLGFWLLTNLLFRWKLIHRAILFSTQRIAQDKFTNLINISDQYHSPVNRIRYWISQIFKESIFVRAISIFFLGSAVTIFFWMVSNLVVDQLCLDGSGINNRVIYLAGWTVNAATFKCFLETSSLSTISLLNASAVGGLLSLLIFYIYRQYKARRRYIVIPFEIIGNKNDGEIEAVANLMTHTLVEELQRIGTLLNLRQIENAYNTTSHDLQAQFVTSGQIHGFAEQMQYLEGVEISSGPLTFSLGSILTRLFLSLTDVRVQGSIQRRDNGTLEILAELTRRNEQSISAEKIIVPDNSTSDIDEITANQIGRELANKLILQLAQGQQVATTAPSLDHFLKGIGASSQRKWWLAISHYRRAIEIEEAQKGVVGLMHYHLGATLFFQGDTERGLRHLELAETDGFVLPENLYMIARAYLHQHWHELHLRQDRFAEIDQRCLKALRLRKEFPEVLNLLGIAYYRLGGLQQRDSTQQWDKDGLIDYPYNKNYTYAVKYLRKAIKQYDKRLSSDTSKNNGTQEQQKKETKRLSEARLAATQQLGNAYRALRGFVEAENAYHDVLLAYPRDIKTLVDLAKTYCMAQNWQRADTFLRRKVLHLDHGYWNPGANFYTGWFLTGGLVNRQYWSHLHRLIYKISGKSEAKSPIILLKAMRHFDFALQQRPRFVLSRWKHNDWLAILKQAIAIEAKGQEQSLKKLTLNDILDKPLDEAVDSENNIFLAQLIFWLSLRITSFISPRGKDAKLNRLICDGVNDYLLHFITDDYEQHSSEFDSKKQVEDPIKNSLPDRIVQFCSAFPKLGDFYIQLIGLRGKASQILTSIDASVRVAGMQHTLRRLELAEEAIQLWEQIQELYDQTIVFQENETPSFNFNLKERIIVDIYAETVLLTLRFLFEGEAYEQAYVVASKANISLDIWRSAWDRNFREREFYFSPNVFRYQFATINAWQAFSALKVKTDPGARLRLKARRVNVHIEESEGSEWATLYSIINDENLFSETVQSSLNTAFSIMKLHPLAMYVQAQLYQLSGLYSQAATELNHLLKVLAPFDPSKYIKTRKINRDHVDSQAQNYDLKKHLDIMEKVNGQLQFDYVVDETSTHIALAELYYEIGKNNLGIEHLHAALIWSPHIDLGAEYFIKLAKRLTFNERFDEAEAVLEAIRIPESILSNKSLSIQKRKDPSIALCVTLTRQWKHGQSYELGQDIARNFRVFALADRPLRYSLIDKYKAIYNDVKSVLEEQEKEFRVVIIKNLADKQNNWHSENTVLENGQEAYYDTMPNIFVSHTKDTIPSLAAKQKLGILNMIPRIFKLLYTIDESEKVKASGALEQAVFLVYLHNELFADNSQSHDAASGVLTLLSPPSENGFSKDSVMKSRILLFFLAEAQRALIQLAELANTLAYNKAELDIRHDQAFEDARFAILIMRFLVETSSDSLPPQQLRELRGTLAQYYDTLGWVYYRANNNFVGWNYADLLKKVDYLPFSLPGLVLTEQEQQSPDIVLLLYVARHQLEQGLKYDTRRAIIHYHLARIHATNLEHLWQRIPDKSSHQDVSRISPYVNMHLRDADRHWRNAKEFDTVDRFHSQLTWLRKRIEVYREAWHNRQVAMFRGDS